MAVKLLALLVAFGLLPLAALAEDLSRYRNFQLGTDLAIVAKQADLSPSDAKVVHRRPALIQELRWRPLGSGPSSQTEPAKEVVFGFYESALFRIVVAYDRYGIEGLTTEDLVELISRTYGVATVPAAPVEGEPVSYGEHERVVAQWQDDQYRFELIRASYGPSFKLVGTLKRLDAPAQAATLEAVRLDDSEAPQREAQRVAREEETERAKLEKARLVNKPKFRL
jgi:hypothetical protein